VGALFVAFDALALLGLVLAGCAAACAVSAAG
jgi:hypothetical protein